VSDSYKPRGPPDRYNAARKEDMTMSKVAAISIYVDDLKKAVSFYQKTLGFKVAGEHQGVVELEHEAVGLVLCEGPKRARAEYPAGVVLGVPVRDVEGKIAELKKLGVELIHTKPQPFPMGQFVACVDPSGNAIELLQFAS
jgi:lactoylglutathione lyase